MWINSTLSNHAGENWVQLQPLLEACKTQLRKFIDSPLAKQKKKFKDLIFKDGRILLQTTADNSSAEVDTSSAISKDGGNSPVQYSIFTRKGDFIIEMETPGMKEEDIKIEYANSETPNYFAVKIYGMKDTTKQADDIDERPTNRYFGTFDRIIEIPMFKNGKYVRVPSLGKKSYTNGVVTFVWSAM